MGFFEWLGLVSDDNRYGSDNPPQENADYYDEYEESVVTPIDQKRRSKSGSRESRSRYDYEDSRYPDAEYAHSEEIEEPSRVDLDRIVTIHPRTYNEARTIGEHYKSGVPVIMNLTDMDHDDAKRLIDFASGLVFGLSGAIERVTAKVFLLSPRNVAVAAEDKERIVSGGFFNQS